MAKVLVLLIVACLYIGKIQALYCKRCLTIVDSNKQHVPPLNFDSTEVKITAMGLPEYTDKCKDPSSLCSKQCPGQNKKCELYEATGTLDNATVTMYYRDCPVDDCPKDGDFVHQFLNNDPFKKLNIKGKRKCCTEDSCNSASSVALSLIQVFIMSLIAM